jgi:hypothetical protein
MGGDHALAKANQRNRFRNKGRRDGPPFLSIEHRISDSEEFGSLSGYGAKLLLELARQYRPGRNGDISIPWSMLKNRGWRSQATVQAAKRELIDAGWIIETRKGGRNCCSLYALTYYKIDESHKHQEPPTNLPPNLWQKQKR